MKSIIGWVGLLIGFAGTTGLATTLTLDVHCSPCAEATSECTVRAASSNGLRYYNQTKITGSLANNHECHVARKHMLRFDDAQFSDGMPYDSGWYVLRTSSGPQSCNCDWLSDSRYKCNRATALWITDQWGRYLQSPDPVIDDVSTVCRTAGGEERDCHRRDRFTIERNTTNACQATLPYFLNMTNQVNLIRY